MTRTDNPASTADSRELRALYEFTDAIYRARGAEDVYTAALNAITRTLGCERASILLFDSEGTMRFVAWRGLSDRYREKLSGHSPWKPGDVDPSPIFVSDIAAADEPQWIKEEIAHEGIVSLGFFPLTEDGRVIGKFMTYYGERQKFEPHVMELAITISRQLGFSLSKARAEASREAALVDLRMSEARFRLMSEQAPVMIWMSDPTGHCQHLNRMAREFWGVDEARIDQFDYASTIHPDDVQEVGGQMGEAIEKREPVVLRGRYANVSGEWRTLQTEARPRFTGDGDFLGMIGVNVDITEQESVARQRELMLAELNHRVKNTLSVVQAIAQQTFKSNAANPQVASFNGRLALLAKAHNMLSRVNWECTPLQQLTFEVLSGNPATRDRVFVYGPPILLPPKQALAVALALHELQTNALKYGALSAAGGMVSLEWQTDEADRLQIVWRETGGPKVKPPTRRGFGTLMIEQGLAADLEGSAQLEFGPEGVVCRIEALCKGSGQ